MGLLSYKDFINESYLYETAMGPEQWKIEKDDGKYRKQFLEFLDDNNKELKISPKFANRYSFNSFKVGEIENIPELKSFIESGAIILDSSPVTIKVKGTEVKLVNLEKTGVFKTSGTTVTSTDVKEGMVIYFYYNPDINFWNDLDVSLQAVNNIQGDALSAKALGEIRNFISNAEEDKKTTEQIYDWQSSAKKLKPFADAGFQITRDKLFNAIRAKGKSITGLAEDNWCPGDIYIYNPSALSGINQALNNAKLIGELNILFNNNFEPISSNSHIGSVWAMSLKQSEARVGKAKEWVVATAPKDTVYNLTKEEQENCKKDLNWGRQEITKYQELIKKFIKGSDITIKYNPEDAKRIKDENVQDKLAGIKLTYHLITIPNNNPKEIDSNLLAVLKFGLKMGDPKVNPPYFKIIGNKKGGDAHVEPYQAGDAVSLLIKGFDSRETMVSIIDRSSAKEVLLYYYANKKDSAYEYKLKVGTGGNVQATVEYQGEFLIGNVNDDPSGVAQQVVSLFNKRN